MLITRSGFTFLMRATVSATLSASTWAISIGVTQSLATFSQLERRREASVIFLKVSRSIAHFLATTEPAAPAPMMSTLSMIGHNSRVGWKGWPPLKAVRRGRLGGGLDSVGPVVAQSGACPQGNRHDRQDTCAALLGRDLFSR